MSSLETNHQLEFDSLLSWLDQDRDVAGQKYENIRQSLIRILSWNGCRDAENVADKAIDVVMKKTQLREEYKGEPAHYFFGVAKNLLREHQRDEKRHAELPEIGFDEQAKQEKLQRDELLDRFLTLCLSKLKSGEAALILDYYKGSRRGRIIHRKGLADEGEVEPNTLRVRVHRIRKRLEQCMKKHLKRGSFGGTY
jgi:DNA-directed RNA polymerase specialized sigma24 family protein